MLTSIIILGSVALVFGAALLLNYINNCRNDRIEKETEGAEPTKRAKVYTGTFGYNRPVDKRIPPEMRSLLDKMD